MADADLNPLAWTDPRTMLAQQLLQGSADTSPVRSWTQELARALSGPVGALELKQINSNRMQAMNDVYGWDGLGGTPGAAAGGQAPQSPGLFQRIGNFLTGNQPSQPDANTPSPAGAIQAGQGAPTAPNGSVATPSGPVQGQPDNSGTPSVPTATPPMASGGTTNPPGAPQAGMPSAFARQLWQGRRMMQVGQERNMPELMQQGASILQKQAEAQLAASGKLLENGKVLNADGSMSPAKGFGDIDAANAALKDAAENPYLIARAAGISHAERGDKIAEALAPEQFKLQTGTQVVQTPNGPRVMTNAQTMQYAKTGALPGGGANPDGTAATGALQDPKVKEAQISEVTASQKRFADAQSRLQNLGQLKTILSNPGLITGAQGDEIQALRGSLLQAYNQAGVKAPTELTQGVASAEALKAAANNLAIEVSKDEGVGTPRVSIFNAISQNKPGLSTSPTGNLIRVLSMEQSAKRESDFGNFAASYYQQTGNYNKQDAESAFAKTHPNSMYTSQIYPTNPAEYAAIPVGGTYVSPDGTVHTKTAQAQQ